MSDDDDKHAQKGQKKLFSPLTSYPRSATHGQVYLGKPTERSGQQLRPAKGLHITTIMPPQQAPHSDASLTTALRTLIERIKISITSNSPPGLIAASKEDPWSKAGKYGLGWVYFSIILLILTTALY